MSLRHRLVLPMVLSGLAVLAGCGSSSNTATPPPTGGFTNSNLKGTYVFSFSGTDAVNGAFFTMVGSMTADGSGGISSGTVVDIVDPAYGPLTSQAISGGNYKITADGRGSGTINTAASSTPFAQVGIDFVLTSSSHGLITRFDNNGGGSGTIDLQDSSVTQSSLGSYAFSLSGVDEGQVNTFSTAGAFTLNGTGIITTGLQDFNDFRNSSGLSNLSLGGSVLLGAAGAPGTAQLAATSSPYGTLSFDVWPIDSTHLKLIETDGLNYIEGDAFTQQTSISPGQLVYTMAGYDSSGFVMSAGGYITYDGSSVISNGLEDINDSGSIGQSLTVAGNLTATGGGRYQLALNGLYNGGTGPGAYTFAAYPSTSGVLLLEIDNAGNTAGTAFLQSATAFTPTEGYALNLTGANSGGEVDDVAEFTANSDGTLSNGLIDEDVSAVGNVSLSFDQKLGSGGTYSYDSSGSGRGLLLYPSTNTTYIGALTLNFYVVDGSNVVMIDVDNGAQVGVGVFQAQTTPASAGLARTAAHFSMLRTAAALRARRRN